jgi:hypothetical protein
MLTAALARVWRASVGLARNPALLLWGLALLAVAALLALLIVYAVERHDAFLRLRPMLCETGITDRKFFLVAVAGPPWLLAMLATLGELAGQLELLRVGRAGRWLPFWLLLGLASGLGALVLFGLAC